MLELKIKGQLSKEFKAMKIRLRQAIVITIATVATAVGFSPLGFAQSNRSQEVRVSAQERIAQTREDTQQKVTEQRETAKMRLDSAKLRACQNREKTITNIMSRMGDRGQRQVDLFAKIADRTQQFYTDKGLSVSNYDELVADVAAKKAAAQTAVDALKSATVEFKCDGDNPKAVADSFKQALKDQNEALKAYKTSVKNLIVGVKSSKSTAGGEQ